MGTEEMERAGLRRPKSRAVFLDRDGTVIEDVDFLTRADQLRILPQVPEALRLLKDAGFLLIVVTNQSAIARGWLTEERLAGIHEELNRMLAAQGARVDAFYYCPHLPGATDGRYAQVCRCRKPEPGLLEQAAGEWNVDLARSYTVGDGERDMEAGRRAGCATVRIGPSAEGRANATSAADAASADLYEAARLIIREDWADAR